MVDTKDCLVTDENGIGHLVIKEVWSVYFLFNGYNIIYIGCSNSLENRIATHKLDKKFDYYTVYFASTDKQEARDMERRMISFCSNYTDHPILNVNGIAPKSKRISVKNG